MEQPSKILATMGSLDLWPGREAAVIPKTSLKVWFFLKDLMIDDR
jgi:hypothetical protein